MIFANKRFEEMVVAKNCNNSSMNGQSNANLHMKRFAEHHLKCMKNYAYKLGDNRPNESNSRRVVVLDCPICWNIRVFILC